MVQALHGVRVRIFGATQITLEKQSGPFWRGFRRRACPIVAFSPRTGSHPPTNWQSAVRRALISAFRSESWRKRPGRQLQISDAAAARAIFYIGKWAARIALSRPPRLAACMRSQRGSAPVYLKSNPILCDNWSRTGLWTSTLRRPGSASLRCVTNFLVFV